MTMRLETDGVAIVLGGRSKRGQSDVPIYLDRLALFLISEPDVFP